MKHASIIAEIIDERIHQEQKWGEQNHDPVVWSTILGEEQGEVCKAILECKPVEYRKELVQLAAVAIAAIDCLDRLEASK